MIDLYLGDGFKHFSFSPWIPGEMIQFDFCIFFKGVEPPNSIYLLGFV